jgi:hypothetical protein
MPGIKFALGENPKRSNFSVPGQPKRYPATRMGVEETIRGAFTEARDYKNSWDAYNKKVATGDKSAVPPPPRSSPRSAGRSSGKGNATSIPTATAKTKSSCCCASLRSFGFKVRTLQHVLEGYKVADELAAAGVGASTFLGLVGLQSRSLRRHSCTTPL